MYEAGLFAGRLTPQRCFIVVPLETKIHLPSDLLGMTVGYYEDRRSQREYESAVASFCHTVEGHIERDGLFEGHLDVRVRELAVRFECCDFIPEDKNDPDPSKARVAKKKQVAAEMMTYCQDHPVNKHRLLRLQRGGYTYKLLTAIIQRPEDGDGDLLMQIEPQAVNPGFATYKVVEAIEALRRAKLINKGQAEPLKQWAMAFPRMNEPDKKACVITATTFS